MLMLWNTARKTFLLTLGAALMAGASFAADQDILSKTELKKLIATANTPQDHQRIARHFDAKAGQLEAEAKDHEELAAEYRRTPAGHEQKHPMSGLTAAHCEYFAGEMRRAAHEARKLAADHREMAKPAGK
jgi:hypothetical protein